MSPGHPPVVVHTDMCSSMAWRGRESGTDRRSVPSTKNLTACQGGREGGREGGWVMGYSRLYGLSGTRTMP
jgi:hypothetical protein